MKKRKIRGLRKFLKRLWLKKNLPNMGKKIVNQVQEVQRVPYRINARRNMSRHILIKLTNSKYKEKKLKAARGKEQVMYKGKPI